MVAIFFVYGLVFFILGFAVLFYPKKDSEFKLADYLYLVAGFGLLHGINEWIDMFLLIEPYSDMRAFVLVRAFTLPVSFICLVQFGARSIPTSRRGFRWLWPAAPVLWAVWLGAFLSGPRNLLMWDIWSRYLLCLPGAMLTGWALALQLPEIRKTNSRGTITSLKVASISFFFYAIIAGAVVHRADFFPARLLNTAQFSDRIGIPVQVFRSICALAMAYGIIRVLSIFHWETRNRIRQSELRFRTIASEAPVMLFMADGDGRITFVEGKAMRGLEGRSGAILGRQLEDVFAKAAGFGEQCRRAMEGSESVSTVEMRGRYFETFMGPVTDTGGENSGIVGVAVDVTTQVESQMELEQYRREMGQVRQMAALGTISERMARQVEGPSGVARVFLQRLLADLKDESPAQDMYKHVREGLAEIKKASDIIGSFYASAELAPAAAAAPFDLQESVNKIIAVFREAAGRAGMELCTAGTDAVPCLRIPARELEQVFFIMVQNAIDAAREGKKNKLMIKAKIGRGQFVLRFIDNCGGIAAETLQHIFEPFARSEAGGRDSGLGLAVALRIVKAYDGDIQVDSKPGKGTTFEIRLPAERVSDA
jgi:PAS domain S-box-containing protein